MVRPKVDQKAGLLGEKSANKFWGGVLFEITAWQWTSLNKGVCVCTTKAEWIYVIYQSQTASESAMWQTITILTENLQELT